MGLGAIFLLQVSFFLLCTLEIHPFKKLCQMILITNLSKIKSMILFGKPTQEEEHPITLVNNLRTCSEEWLPIIPQKDQKLKK